MTENEIRLSGRVCFFDTGLCLLCLALLIFVLQKCTPPNILIFRLGSSSERWRLFWDILNARRPLCRSNISLRFFPPRTCVDSTAAHFCLTRMVLVLENKGTAAGFRCELIVIWALWGRCEVSCCRTFSSDVRARRLEGCIGSPRLLMYYQTNQPTDQAQDRRFIVSNQTEDCRGTLHQTVVFSVLFFSQKKRDFASVYSLIITNNLHSISQLLHVAPSLVIFRDSSVKAFFLNPIARGG